MGGPDQVADVLVVGAGPAGATAALAALHAEPSARVTLLDAYDFPRDKSCGDGVAPHAFDELATLGVDVDRLTAGHGPVPLLDLHTPGGVRVRARPHRPNRVIPRRVLDARIVAAAVAAGARLVRHRVRHLEVARDRVVVDGVHAGRVLVAADGANSVVRRALGLPRNPDRHLAVAVRGYAPGHEPDPGPGADGPAQLIALQREAWPAYAWSFPLADGTGRANVGYGRLRSALAGRDSLHGELARLLPGQPATQLRAHHLPLSTWRPRQPDGRVLLVGDAASLVNPLTGEGIFYAVRSGRLAGRAAVDPGGAGAGVAYRTALEASLGRHLRHTTALAMLTRYRPAFEAALTAAGPRPHLMNRLVDLGLGDGLVPAALVPLTLAAYLRAPERRRMFTGSTGRTARRASP